MTKQYKLLLLFLIMLLFLAGCSLQSVNKRISKTLGIVLPENVAIEYEDNHSGFHGDGESIAVIKFDRIAGEQIHSDVLNNKKWNSLPLSENLNLLMYGGEKNNINYGYNLADKLDMPIIENGFYFYVNRHSNRISSNDDSDIFNQNSFNFTIAIYDIDTQTMYYLEYDT